MELNSDNRLTLSQLTAYVGNALRNRPELCDTWVVAELSDVRLSGGHCYMELIEKSELTGSTVAKMRCTVWASNYSRMRRKFLDATGKDIVSGLKVMLRGGVQHHSIYGLSFNAIDIDPNYTLGDMERLRKEILRKLSQLNVVNDNRTLAFPAVPQRIAVISAAGAAGYGDFMNQIEHNTDGFVFYPKLYQAVMQGERTAPSVIACIEEIESHKEKWDCIVIIRGGGSTTDLNGFDNFELAYKICTCELPVVVGIGHERDRTVLDEIARVRCKTPTAVAEFLVGCLRESSEKVGRLVDFIIRYGKESLAGEERRLSSLTVLLPEVAGRKISDTRLQLNMLAGRLPAITQQRIEQSRGQLDNTLAMLRVLSGQRIADAGRTLEDFGRRLQQGSELMLKEATTSLGNLESLLNVLNPQNTLKRGYSVTRVNGHAVTDIETLKSGEIIDTQLYGGSIKSRIENIGQR